MKHWRKLAALCLVGIMVFALAACAATKEDDTKPADTQTSTETPSAPTGEGISVNENLVSTIDPETYKEYIGTWYADGSSASYRINVTDQGTWNLSSANGEVVCSGSLRIDEEEEVLEMYDPDGSLAITVSIVADGTLHADIMIDSLIDSLSTNTFLNQITNDVSNAPATDVDDSTSVDSSEDVIVSSPTEDDIAD